MTIPRLFLAGGRMAGGGIDAPVRDIAAHLTAGTIVVVKGVFEESAARRLRDLVFAWGQQREPSAQRDFYALAAENHACLERGVSKIQKTLHYYRSHNFNRLPEVGPAELRALLIEFCAPLRDLYNRISGHAADFSGERVLHPQVLHYPSGGGHFARHVHALEPQRIGVIVSLAKRGEDFQHGGTGFDVDGDVVDIESEHDAGDIALFRYDLPHWVRPVDIEQPMNLSSPRGRWTLVLPYY